MKKIIYTAPAAKDLRKYRSDIKAITAKVSAYAANPESLANKVTKLQGRDGYRLRVGEFRVLFELTADEMIVTKIAPRGKAYD